MGLSRSAACCGAVLFWGLLLIISVSAETTSEEEFYKWVATHQAKQAALSVAAPPPASVDFVSATTPKAVILTVGLKGAQFKSVGKAVAAIPKANTKRYIILISAGIFTEKVLIPATLGKVTLQGAGIGKTFIRWGDTAAKAGSTAKSASVTVISNYFIAQDISFVNTAPAPKGGAVGAQAVAFLIAGDFAQFYRVGFYGAQDTLYDKLGRHYFKDCYIQGSIDFVFGDGQSYYSTTQLHSIASPFEGSLTAQHRLKSNELSGFSFVSCWVTGTGPIYLGRAWGPFSRVVFSYTWIDVTIIPGGWFNWGIPARQKTVFYAEFLNTGPGSATAGLVPWSRVLTPAQASPFVHWSFIDGDLWIGKV